MAIKKNMNPSPINTEIWIGLHSPIKDFEDRAKAKGKTEKEERR
jgi:hypothetical protein